MCSRLELVALVRRCRLTPTCFASLSVLLKARVNSRPSQPLWSCPGRIPSLRFRGFSNPFLKIGVRGGDSGAEPPAVELSCLLVCKYPKKSRPHLSAGKSVPCLLLSLVVPQGFGAFQKQAAHGSDESPGLWRFLLVQSLRRRDSPAG